MNSPVYFELQADQPARAIDFYQTVFGWKFEPQTGLPRDYWSIATDSLSGGLLRRSGPVPPTSATNAAVLSLEVVDFDRSADDIIRAGGQVALAKFAVPGKCWQGYFTDPEANTFGIFQVDLGAQ